jgi:hypothetical protein
MLLAAPRITFYGLVPPSSTSCNLRLEAPVQSRYEPKVGIAMAQEQSGIPSRLCRAAMQGKIGQRGDGAIGEYQREVKHEQPESRD